MCVYRLDRERARWRERARGEQKDPERLLGKEKQVSPHKSLTAGKGDVVFSNKRASSGLVPLTYAQPPSKYINNF